MHASRANIPPHGLRNGVMTIAIECISELVLAFILEIKFIQINGYI